MKKMISATFVVVILIVTSVPALARDPASGPEMIVDVVVDVVIARPVGLVSIVTGTAAYIVALPFAITSGSVKTLQPLVVWPFNFTFNRPVGDFSSLER